MNDKPGKNRIKLIVSLFCAAVLLGVIIFIVKGVLQNSQNTVSENDLVITCLDVGKADAAIFTYRQYTGIIDTGTEEAFDKINAYLTDHSITSIDCLIISHFDKDHIGSAVAILQKYPVKNVYYPDYVSTKKLYEPLMAELSVAKDGRIVTAVDDDISIQYEDLTVELIGTKDPRVILNDSQKIDNNMSLMCRLDLGSKRMLFTGDIEYDRIQQILDDHDDVSADWIKYPHHGAYEKNEDAFLDMVGASCGVISTGSEKEPDKKLIKYLKKKKIRYYVTSAGDVTTICDGDSITLSQSRPFSVIRYIFLRPRQLREDMIVRTGSNG